MEFFIDTYVMYVLIPLTRGTVAKLLNN